MMHQTRKTRIFLATLALLCGALLWLWLDRDRAAGLLVNAVLPGQPLRELQGLELSPSRARVKQLTLKLADGATLQLHDLQLQRPLDLLFRRRDNHSQLSAGALSWAAPAHPAAEEGATGTLRLSDSLQQLQRYLPESFRIDNLNYGQELRDATLNIKRDADRSIAMRLSAQDRALQLLLKPDGARWQLSAVLTANTETTIANLNGTLLRAGEHWRVNLDGNTSLDQLAALPLPALSAHLAGASGELQLRLRGQLPDALLQREAYRDFTLQLLSDGATLPIPAEGTPLTLSIRTVEPLVVAFESLQPLRPRDLRGSAELALRATDSDSALLQAHLQSESKGAQAQLSASGQLDFAAAAPLLESAAIQQQLAPLALRNPGGKARFHAAATLPQLRGGADSLHDVSLTLEPGATLSGELINTAAQNNTAKNKASPWRRGAVKLQLPKPLGLTAAQWPGDLRLRAETAQLHVAETRGNTIDTTLSAIDCRWGSTRHCNLHAQIQAPALTSAQGGAKLTETSADADLSLTLGVDGRQDLQLQQLTLSIAHANAAATTADNIALHGAELHCQLNQGGAHCAAPALDGTVATVKTDAVEVGGAFQLQTLRFSSSDSSASATIHANGLQLRTREKYRAELDIDGDARLGGDSLTVNGTLRAGNLQLHTNWKQDIAQDRGAGKFQLAPAKFTRESPLSQSIQGLPVDIVAGTLSAQGALHWPLAERDTVQLDLDQIAPVYGDSFAVDTRGHLSLVRRNNRWQTPAPQPVQLETLDVGLPAKNVRFTLSLDGKQDLTLGDIHAELLEGSLSSTAVTWNLAGKERRSLVTLEGISLHALAKAMQANNFAASGILDMQIPLITGKDGITVERGHVAARPPGGRLRYYGAFSPQMLASNPSLKLIAGALEDYNYRELSGTIEYPPSGDMQMDLKLVGRSKSVSADRDLIINLNLENSIPDTLRSLQASRDLTDALEKQLK
ncbi:YdbH domain-containing protein [Microbulbifer sp. SAOS-129_SWC]|uniref:intermembrane phospholipid transport protein YdbH family protein n=1 Tax=Microbulbifer sp. SAOS-129_SWC TaxID=3145235 RepID=UPI003217ED08